MALESLEDRTLLSAIGSENLLVISDTFTASFLIREYTRSGDFVQSFPTPYPGGRPFGEKARDLALGADGRIHVYNGTQTPYLSTLDPVTSTWTHASWPEGSSLPGSFRSWNTVDIDGFGGIAVLGDRIYATDTGTGSDSVGGIVRFDAGGATRFSNPSSNLDLRDLNVGLDGRIYTVDEDQSNLIRAWNPTTMSQEAPITLQTTQDVRGIAVDASGNIFAVTWEGSLYKFDTAGSVLLQLDANALPKGTSGANNLVDIDVSVDGAVAIGNAFGDVYVTDLVLSLPQHFDAGSQPVYVAFANQGSTPGGIAGTVYSDRDGDGSRDVWEPGTPGVTVYIDLDNDGTLDAGEPTTTSDAGGNYEFTNLPVGEHVVREVIPNGFTQSQPGSRPAVYYAAGRNADIWRIDATTGAATRIGSTGGPIIHGLVATNDGRLYGAQGNGQPDSFYSIDPLTGHATLLGPIGGELAWGMAYDAATDTIYGIVYVSGSGANRLGTFDRTTGAFTPVPGGIGVSPNLLNGTAGIAFDSLRRRIIVYEWGDGQTWEFTLDGTARQLPTNTPNLGLNLTFDGRRFIMKRDFDGSNNRLIEIDPDAGSWSPCEDVATISAAFIGESLDFVPGRDFSYVATVAPGVTVGGFDFGHVTNSGGIRGTVWDDLDGDGVRDAGEPGLAGARVYLDLNDNGVQDDESAQTTTVDPGAYAHGTVLTDAAPGVTLAAVTPSGDPFDAVKALGGLFGHREPYGAEAVFWGLGFPTLRAEFDAPADSVTVRILAYSGASGARGWIRAFDAAGTQIGEVFSDPLSGSEATLLTLSADGIDHVLVSGTVGYVLIEKLAFTTPTVEPTTVTDADGVYAFEGLAAGTYSVRQFVPNGYFRMSAGNDANVFYATAYVPGGGGVMKLITIDVASGAIAWIGDPLPLRLFGLVRTNSGELFATSFADDKVYAVDPATGRVTPVGTAGFAITGGLAYDPVADELYTLGRTMSEDTVIRLLRINRETGQATPIGPGTPSVPGSAIGPTGVSSLAFDRATRRVIALDNADGEFYAFDLAGNATRLSLGPNVRSFALSDGPDGFVLQPGGTGNGFLASIDPATAQTAPYLTLSEAAVLEALDWNYDRYRFTVAVDGLVVDGIDFGDRPWNASPVAVAGGPYVIREGDPLALSGAGTTDPDGDLLAYEWDLNNDGTLDATTQSVGLTWQQLVAAGIADDGVYTVRLRVSDSRTLAFDVATLTVLNADPVLDAYTLTPALIAEGGTATVNGAFHDVNPLDTHTVVIDWRDGATTVIDMLPGVFTFNASHAYADVSAGAPLQYAIRVTVRDDDGGTATDQRTLDVTRPAPQVTGIRFGDGEDRWLTPADLGDLTASWRISQFAFTFDRDVFVDIGDLVVTGAAGGPLAFATFDYQVATRTAVWTLATPVDQDRLSIALDGDDAAADGNDGVRASGGALTGGDYLSSLDVLFGDVSGDGEVTLLDSIMLRGRMETTEARYDLNGDGTVTLIDAILLRGRNGTSLP